MLNTPVVPLHYTIYFGVDYAGSFSQIYAVPLMGLVFSFVNTILGYVMYNRMRILSYILNVVSILVHIILIAALIFIILFNS